MVKTGQAIPLWYDPNYNGETFSVPKVMQGSSVPSFPETPCVPVDDPALAPAPELGAGFDPVEPPYGPPNGSSAPPHATDAAEIARTERRGRMLRMEGSLERDSRRAE